MDSGTHEPEQTGPQIEETMDHDCTEDLKKWYLDGSKRSTKKRKEKGHGANLGNGPVVPFKT